MNDDRRSDTPPVPSADASLLAMEHRTGEGDRPFQKQILIAGVGNAWMRDDGFGGEVIRRLEQLELPEGVRALDFGSGGLDLAYEVMRGYDAMVLIDASEQDGAPGSIYLIEPDPDEIGGSIEDGEVIDPHGMGPLTVLRFVKYVGAWPGRVIVVACEPETIDAGYGLTDTVTSSLEQAVEVVMKSVTELLSDEAYATEGSSAAAAERDGGKRA
jgi:hydrogenase maturation protease